MPTPDQKHGTPSHLELVFDGDTLFLKNLKCLKGRDEHFKAVSGNLRSDAIPDGLYWIQTGEIHVMKWSDDWTPRGFSKPTLLAAEILEGRIWGALPSAMMRHMGAWGEYRIPIRQAIDQEQRTGRSKMFVHGGDNYGSAGCIDLGHHISLLVEFLRKDHPTGDHSIDLIVHRKQKP
jgi:hypothetical protein